MYEIWNFYFLLLKNCRFITLIFAYLKVLSLANLKLTLNFFIHWVLLAYEQDRSWKLIQIIGDSKCW